MKDDKVLSYHYGGKIGTCLTKPLARKDLAVAYTPGVAIPARAIAKNTKLSWDYTGRGNRIAILTDGTRNLGLGNTGPEAALPVMEGKAMLFKRFGGVDAMPTCIRSSSVNEMVAFGKALEPTVGCINVEDVSSPECFEVVERLQKELHIPVFHDDQHGTAAVVLAGLLNALKVVGKRVPDTTVVIVGAGAAGAGTANLLNKLPFKDLLVCDHHHGIIHRGMPGLSGMKKRLAETTNKKRRHGHIADALVHADVVIGLSAPGTITRKMVAAMEDKAIVFALANPDPEIEPEDALAAGAAVVGTGRSSHPNQINNLLAFPGVVRALLDARAKKFTVDVQLAAAEAIAAQVRRPTATHVVPSPFDHGVHRAVALEVYRACLQRGLARRKMNLREYARELKHRMGGS